jgi:hypothetical protein
MKEAVAILENLTRSAFWGELSFTFQGGVIVLIRKTETTKPRGSNPDAASRP